MAFDGITIAAMVRELHLNLDGGRFNKIAQPEADELLITGKGANGQCRLVLSGRASLPISGLPPPFPAKRVFSSFASSRTSFILLPRISPVL